MPHLAGHLHALVLALELAQDLLQRWQVHLPVHARHRSRHPPASGRVRPPVRCASWEQASSGGRCRGMGAHFMASAIACVELSVCMRSETPCSWLLRPWNFVMECRVRMRSLAITRTALIWSCFAIFFMSAMSFFS